MYNVMLYDLCVLCIALPVPVFWPTIHVVIIVYHPLMLTLQQYNNGKVNTAPAEINIWTATVEQPVMAMLVGAFSQEEWWTKHIHNVEARSTNAIHTAFSITCQQ